MVVAGAAVDTGAAVVAGANVVTGAISVVDVTGASVVVVVGASVVIVVDGTAVELDTGASATDSSCSHPVNSRRATVAVMILKVLFMSRS